jgi:phage tail-like protein
MARAASIDKLDKFRFKVTIPGFTKMGFTSVESPSVQIGTTEYHEGGAHLYPRQIVDKAQYKPITLQRGVCNNIDFFNWIVDIFDIQLPNGANATNAANAPNPVLDYRREIIIEHLDRVGRTIKQYNLFNCIPVEFVPASDFAADGDDGFSIEKLVLKYESFEVITPQTKGSSATNVKDVAKRLIRNSF